jgi:2-polyprenyl-3-methyl-5-hydroxy-6-metoxy-1,4-benzoquinol methylase
LEVDFPACIERQFPEEFPTAWRVTNEVLDAIRGVDLEPLARRSPGLRGYNWTEYLRCSVVRMVRVLRALRTHVPQGSRVLDCGSYFGNVSTMCALSGYTVDAVDAYEEYSPALDRCASLLRGHGVNVRDFATVGKSFEHLVSDSYDAVLCLGVIEHIPHTPRLFMESLTRTIKPGGVLVLDTPNIAYLYNRQRLARGETVMGRIDLQYETELPFEGHHREYTIDEIRWLLTRLGLHTLSVETFNYSMYSLATLSGERLTDYRQMEADPSMREVIMAAAERRRTAP